MAGQRISSGSPFEGQIGFSRAIRIGNIIAVSGTAPLEPDGSTACPGDVYGQAKRCLEIIGAAVEQAGGKMHHVVRTRVMLGDITLWEEAACAHGEYFGSIRPTRARSWGSRASFVLIGWSRSRQIA